MTVLALLPMMVAAQTVTSPNGNVTLTFSLTEQGQPTYEMSYKGKKVVNPSHLGLALACDKHASKGMNETDLMEGFKVKDPPNLYFRRDMAPRLGRDSHYPQPLQRNGCMPQPAHI